MNSALSVTYLHAKPLILKWVRKLLLLTLTLLALSAVLNNSKVGALDSLSPDPGPLPTDTREYLLAADRYPQTPAVRPWIALESDPAATTVSLSSSARTVRLGYRYIGTVGWSHDSPCCGVPPQSGWLLDIANQIESTPTASGPTAVNVSGLPGGTRRNLTGFNDTPGYTAQFIAGFDLNAPNGFVDGSYMVTFPIKSINHFSNNTYQCIGGSQAYTTRDNFGPCSTIPVSVDIRVDIPDGNYSQEATLTALSAPTGCASPGSVVRAGDILCLAPGMKNIGDAEGPDVTYVELNSSHPQYLEPVFPQPTGNDPAYMNRGYNSGTMANGESEPHYWWGRSRPPRMGAPGWSVQYQPTKLRVRSGTPSGTKLCFQTLVNPGTPGGGYVSSNPMNGDGSICYDVNVPVPELPELPEGCLTMPNPLQTVTLPDQSPNSPSGKTGYSFVRSDTYYQDVRQRRTRVVDINDISSGGSRVEPTLVPGSDNTYQLAVLDYSPYVPEYPFDFNKPSVTYDSYYNRTTWRSSSSRDGYICPSGYTLVGSGPTCENYYIASRYYTCPSGWSGPSGNRCYRTEYQPATQQTTYSCPAPWDLRGSTCRRGRWSMPAHRTTTYGCPSGWNQSGSYCYRTAYTYAYGPYYYCPYGGTLLGGSPRRCRRTTSARPYYNWHNTGTQNNRTTRSTTTNTYLMRPCYNRTYDATPTAGTASLRPDRESPTRSAFSASIDVIFGVAHNSGRTTMRQRSEVNLPYTISYYVQRANGSSGPVSDANNYTRIYATSANKNSNGSDSVSHEISVSVPGTMQVGDRVCWTLYTTRRTGGSQTAGQVNTSGNIVSGSGQRQSQRCSPIVINEPYLRVYGGDVMAGSGFGVGCLVNNNAAILGWNRDNGAGSAVQFAAQAAAAITDFTSATTRTSAPVPPKDLSFGNVSGTYGGGFGSGLCAKDYFANASNIETSYPPPASTYTVPIGARQVVYIDGDAHIRRNIVYAGSGAWTDLSQIPSYYLVVRGNIYISENVTQLDGVYIAQPAANGSGGRIYTCVGHGNRNIFTTSPQAFNNCNRKLTINGAFIARQVRFLRTNGSLRDSSPGEQASSPTIAEVFNFSPELFLVDPGLSAAPARQYDSAAALPPVL